MYSSVKFFDPTVSLTPELSGFFWIRPALAVVEDSSLLLPHAATPTPRTAVARTANSARSQ
jgi:hypothetical protein